MSKIGVAAYAAVVSGAVVILVGLLIDQQIHTRFAIITAIIAASAAVVFDRRPS